MKITEPKEVGSIWPLHGNDKLFLEDIIAAINDNLSERDPDSKAYSGRIGIDVPASYNLAESISVIIGTFEIKAREAKWRVATLKLVESSPLKATFEFLLGR